MKKSVISIAVLLLVMLAYSCSKDHDAPTFSLYSSVKTPTNVEATFDATTSMFIITWEMDTTGDDGLVDYIISVSDDADFEGTVFTKSNGSLTRRKEMSSSFISSAADTAVRYFSVHGVYNTESLKQFVGPSSVADSALFIRQEDNTETD